MKLSAVFAKLFGDLWHGRGAFARLAEAPRWRVLLVECAVLAMVCGGFYYELMSVMLELEAERRELEAARARRDLLAGFVLDKESQARVLSTITDPAAHPGLEFVSMSPLPKQNLAKYARCRASVTVTGAFEDFLRFVRTLESEGTPCSLIKIEVASRWEEEKPKSERISFLVETYAEADPLPEGEAPR
jgi:Tfp pilus assembly protein PilO